VCVNRKHKLFTSQEEQELRRGIRYLQAHACSHVPSASERSARRAVREQEQLLRRKLALQEGEGEGDEEGEEDDGAELWGARKPAYYGEGVEVRGPASAAVPRLHCEWSPWRGPPLQSSRCRLRHSAALRCGAAYARSEGATTQASSYRCGLESCSSRRCGTLAAQATAVPSCRTEAA